MTNTHPQFVDHTGKKIGLVTIKEYVGHCRQKGSIWKATCDCGAERIVSKANFSQLRSNSSCKCHIAAKVQKKWNGKRGYCRKCNEKLPRNRYFHCETCTPDLGDETLTYSIAI